MMPSMEDINWLKEVGTKTKETGANLPSKEI